MRDEELPPIEWPALLKWLAKNPRAHAMSYGVFMQRVREAETQYPLRGYDLLFAVDALCSATAMGQGEMLKKPIAVLLERASMLARRPELIPPLTRNGGEDGWPMGALGAFCLAEALSHPVDEVAIETVLAKLRSHPDPSDMSQRVIAWASLAFGRADGLYEFLLVDAARQPPNPETQELRGAKNAQTFLARCALHDAGDELLIQGWRNYLHQFPLLNATERATWVELLWAARAVHTVALRHPPNELVGWLRDELAAAP